MQYKKLLSETEFLKVKQRARMLRGTDLVAIEYDQRRLIFKTRSGTDPRIIWVQTIEVTDAYIDNILSQKNFASVKDLIMHSDLKIHCTCPAFLYWGYKYLAWKKGYGLEKETRRPVVRNPFGKGFVCFTADAQVLTPSGEVAISTIKPGDRVISHTNQVCRVRFTSKYRAKDLVQISYNDSTVTCTANHPFYVFRNNQVELIAASSITTSDYLLKFGSQVSYDGQTYDLIPVTAVTPAPAGKQYVYNLTVENDNTFVVNGAITHNCKHLYLVLETYPFWASTLAKKFKDYFDKVQQYREEHPEVSDSVRHEYFQTLDRKRQPIKLSNPRLR